MKGLAGMGVAIVALGVAVSFDACSSSSVCSNLDSAANALSTKVAPCLGDAGLSFTPTLPSKSTCDNAISKCSSSDQTDIDNFSTCVENLPSCNPSDMGETFVAAFSLCTSDVQGLSSACQSALGTNADGGT